MSYIPRLQTQYAEDIAPALMKQFEYKSVMQVPRIVKICLNQGLGKAVADRIVKGDMLIFEVQCFTALHNNSRYILCH